MESPSEPIVWLEAEQFTDYGGWVNDPQFIETMGSPYLLAQGMGRSVADAVTCGFVPRTGRYRLWTRCKDWYPSHSPGRFQILIGGRCSAIIFGRAEDAEWRWVDGGWFDLVEGEVEIRLHDLTGWWGRCDALVLSGEAGWRPADDLETLTRQRRQYGGESPTLARCGPYDVVVAGGGLAGTAAAVTAARHGCAVTLIHDRPVLGGNGSTELQVPVFGDQTRETWDPEESGLIEEFDPAQVGGDWSSNLEKTARAEPRLDLYLDTHLTGVTMADRSRIRAVEAVHTRTGRRIRFAGRLFIDCTGDAWLGYGAGADFRHGRESRNEFAESLAPATADRHTMGGTLYAGELRRHDHPVPFAAPGWAYHWNSPVDFEQQPMETIWSDGSRPAHFDDLGRGKGRRPDRPHCPIHTWYVELGGMLDTCADAETIRDDLLRLNLGLWDYVKNHDPAYREQNTNWELVSLSYLVGKRESRRLLGDYVLSQRDYDVHVLHDDTAAYGGWTIDEHHPQAYFTRGPISYHACFYKISIPYRSLYSRNVDNLLMAGRNISATHVALSGTRVMRTCCLLGQAAGTAAAIAASRDLSPRELGRRHLSELQQTLLKDGAYLLGVPNRDPADLARGALVSASSRAAGDCSAWLIAPQSYWAAGAAPLNIARAVMFRASKDRLDSAALFLRSRRDRAVSVCLTLRAAEHLGNFRHAADVASAAAEVPPHFIGWLGFDLHAHVRPGACYYLTLPATEGLCWDLYSYNPPDTLRGFRGPEWEVLWGCHKFRLTPGGEPTPSLYVAEHGPQYCFAPENVLDGFHRAVRGEPHSWAPDPSEPLPQWLELKFARPVAINTAHVSFQLALLAPRRYSLRIPAEGDWHPVVQADNNRQRRRVHRFATATTDRLRLVIEDRRPDAAIPLTPVCEIRLYHET
ncbi:MAG: FAD-dependent oxidoreductase [Pirellulales bacterium]|nr:FAD-dependent oxidoreductase [Pirellulales bacterium]